MMPLVQKRENTGVPLLSNHVAATHTESPVELGKGTLILILFFPASPLRAVAKPIDRVGDLGRLRIGDGEGQPKLILEHATGTSAEASCPTTLLAFLCVDKIQMQHVVVG